VEDLSLHILDIAENALRAHASRIEIVISSDSRNDLLTIEVSDDGKGMDPDTLAKVRDPFFTTKRKKTGLGIPLIAQAAELAEGKFAIESTSGKGTRVKAVFRLSHIDRPAVGDMAGTVLTLIAGHPEVDILYEEGGMARSADWIQRRSSMNSRACRSTSRQSLQPYEQCSIRILS